MSAYGLWDAISYLNFRCMLKFALPYYVFFTPYILLREVFTDDINLNCIYGLYSKDLMLVIFLCKQVKRILNFLHSEGDLNEFITDIWDIMRMGKTPIHMLSSAYAKDSSVC